MECILKFPMIFFFNFNSWSSKLALANLPRAVPPATTLLVGVVFL